VYSLENLKRLTENRPLEPKAARHLEERLRERSFVKGLVEKGCFEQEGGLAWATVRDRLDAAFLPSLLPKAELIALFQPHPDGWVVKLRLGNAAPTGASIHQMDVQDFDPNYGGRWNAGANARAGGTEAGPREYVPFLLGRMDRLHSSG